MRWLVSHHKYEEANKQLFRIARANHGTYKEDLIYPDSKAKETMADSNVAPSEWKEFKSYMAKPKLVFYLFVLCFIR